MSSCRVHVSPLRLHRHSRDSDILGLHIRISHDVAVTVIVDTLHDRCHDPSLAVVLGTWLASPQWGPECDLAARIQRQLGSVLLSSGARGVAPWRRCGDGSRGGHGCRWRGRCDCLGRTGSGRKWFAKRSCAPSTRFRRPVRAIGGRQRRRWRGQAADGRTASHRGRLDPPPLTKRYVPWGGGCQQSLEDGHLFVRIVGQGVGPLETSLQLVADVLKRSTMGHSSAGPSLQLLVLFLEGLDFVAQDVELAKLLADGGPELGFLGRSWMAEGGKRQRCPSKAC